MSKNEQNCLDNLEECFDKLLFDYNNAQDEIKKLKEYIELLTSICNDNYIEIPPIDEPVPF